MIFLEKPGPLGGERISQGKWLDLGASMYLRYGVPASVLDVSGPPLCSYELGLGWDLNVCFLLQNTLIEK